MDAPITVRIRIDETPVRAGGWVSCVCLASRLSPRLSSLSMLSPSARPHPGDFGQLRPPPHPPSEHSSLVAGSFSMASESGRSSSTSGRSQSTKSVVSSDYRRILGRQAYWAKPVTDEKNFTLSSQISRFPRSKRA